MTFERNRSFRPPGAGIRCLEQWGRDLLFSFRSLRRAPGLSLAVVATLTLCIGANATIFTALYGLILKPLPYRDPGQLVEIYNSMPKGNQPKRPVSITQYVDYKAHAGLFEGFALWQAWTFTVGEEGEPARGIGARVTADYFSLLGVQPLLGRFYTMEECAPGRDHVLVLTQSFWESNYGADPKIIGRVIHLSSEPYTIIGVAPRRLEQCNGDAILLKPFEWLPGEAAPQARFSLGPTMYGRVRIGVAPSAALAQLATLESRYYRDVAQPVFRDYLDRNGYRVALGQVRAEQTKSVKDSLLLLQGGALLVLLLGCLNVASLLLARGNSRQGELAIRQALGASRSVLAGQMLVESMVLVCFGALAGIGIAWGSLRVINSYALAIVRQAPAISLDGTILGVTLLGSLAAAVFIGALPALRLCRTDLLKSMHGGSRGASAGRALRAASGSLVVAQVALALTLLVGADLLISSFARVLKVAPGYEASRVVHARVALNASYQNLDASHAVADRIVTAMRAIPGVEAVSITSHMPTAQQFPVVTLPIRGSTLGPQDTFPTGTLIGVSPEFFATMGIRIIEGRCFNAADNQPNSRRVFIVDRNFAQKYFHGSSAVGQLLMSDPKLPPNSVPMIVGVAEVARFNSPDDRTGLPMVYSSIMGFQFNGFSMEIRTDRPLAGLLPLMRARMRSIDPALPLYQVQTLETLFDSYLDNRRGVMLLLGGFACIALLLAAVGIYGMLAYDVSQRTREIGIRGAIGASRGQITSLILRQGLTKAGIGIGLGLVGALFLTRFMTGLLYEVRPTDPAAYALVSLVLLAIASLASYLPARRAARVDPVVALRVD